MADSWAEKLDIYLDGELPADQMSALDTHVRGCSECAADVLRRLQLKRAVQTTGKRYSPSLELRQRIQQTVGTRPRQKSWIWQIVAVAAVALVVTQTCPPEGDVAFSGPKPSVCAISRGRGSTG